MVVTISKLFLPLDFLFQKACLTKCVNKTDLLAQFIITKLARTENFDSIRPQNSRVVLVDKIQISAKLCINLDNYRIKQGHFGAYGESRKFGNLEIFANSAIFFTFFNFLSFRNC